MPNIWDLILKYYFYTNEWHLVVARSEDVFIRGNVQVSSLCSLKWFGFS